MRYLTKFLFLCPGFSEDFARIEMLEVNLSEGVTPMIMTEMEDWVGKGHSAFANGDLVEARTCFEKALKGCEYYEASLAKGFTLIALERYHQALKDFKFSTRTFSESFELSLGKGLAQMGLRRYFKALKFLDRAIRLRPNEACIWHEKGRLLGKMGREEEARAAYAEGKRLRQAGEMSLSFWPYELAESLNKGG